jgi:hypothetical protein
VYRIRRCETLPPHPAGIDEVVTELDGLSAREQHQAALSEPTCATCHAIIDPSGFAFLNFDADGRYQSTDGGFPIDASGELTDTGQTFDGAIELQAMLATSSDTPACLTRWLLQNAEVATSPTAFQCALSELDDAASPDDSVRALLRRVVMSEAFRSIAP